jgi:uncharacterized repeat protein (TIGR02543 family)
MQRGLGYEGIDVVKIGVMMGFISILLVYVIYGINVGKGIGNEAYNMMSEAELDTNKANLKSLSYNDYVILPTAAVYALTQYNSTELHDLTCYICDNIHGKYEKISDTPCLLDHLEGKVKLTTEYDEMLGQYHISIEPYSYTIKFNANGGSGNMASQEFIYDTANSSLIEGQALRKNSYYKQGYVFAGWSLTKGGSVSFTNCQKIKNFLLFGEITLYAVWTK